MAPRRKCFLSYHAEDTAAVEEFIERFSDIFIPKAIGVRYTDDFINSKDSDYIMRRLREKYLTDSTVTIVLVGKCTAKRKYVDWEIASTLRNDENNKRSGLLGINLWRSRGMHEPPPRLAANVNGTRGYALYNDYPKDGPTLRRWIESAFKRRRSQEPSTAQPLFGRNKPCK